MLDLQFTSWGFAEKVEQLHAFDGFLSKQECIYFTTIYKLLYFDPDYLFLLCSVTGLEIVFSGVLINALMSTCVF